MADEVVATAEPEVVEEKQDTSTPFSELFEPKKEAPKEATPTEAIEEKAEEKAEEVKTEEKPTEKVEEKPTVSPFESEMKAITQKHQEAVQWAQRVSSENGQLRRQLDMINKKLDGQWTEQDEQQQQVVGPSPEQMLHMANVEGKISASLQYAYDSLGEEKVKELLFNPDSPYQKIANNPTVQMQVFSSDAPVMEALKITEATMFFDKWGRDPKAIETNMRKSIEGELTEKITQQVMKRLSGKTQPPVGLRDVKAVETATEGTAFTPLDQLFPK